MKRTAIVAILAGLLLASSGYAQSLWNPKMHARSITSDTTARGLGDILTIVIDETTQVKNDENTQLDKESSLSAVLSNFNILPNMFNTLPEVEGNQKRSFDGKAKYDKDQQFKTKISVIVQDVMPNGVLLIEGTRRVVVDQETKIIRIQGMVRPNDVARDNTVASSFVANAVVSYEGDGFMSQTTMKGWFSRLLDFVWPF